MKHAGACVHNTSPSNARYVLNFKMAFSKAVGYYTVCPNGT